MDMTFTDRVYVFDTYSTALNATYEFTTAITESVFITSWHISVVQFILCTIGILSNLATFVIMIRKGQSFSVAFRYLVANQAILDMSVCLIGLLLLFDPITWTKKIKYLYLIGCYLWHAKTPYWFSTYMSTFNLVGIAVERYIAVCSPFRYKRLDRKQIKKVMIMILALSCMSVIPNFLRPLYERGPCSDLLLQKESSLLNKIYSVYIIMVAYVFPVLAFCALYGCVIRTLTERKRTNHIGSVPSVISSAQKRLTATSIVLTLIFIGAIGTHVMCYALGSANVVDYTSGSTLQKLGVTCSLVNSLVNPFVYAALMPSFRKAIARTFCSVKCEPSTEDTMTPSASVGSAIVEIHRKPSRRLSHNMHYLNTTDTENDLVKDVEPKPTSIDEIKLSQ